MSIEYLEELDRNLSVGKKKYACPGPSSNEWFIADSVEELEIKAQRTADARKFKTYIYRLVNKMEALSGDCYLVVRKIGERGPRGDSHLLWSLVDTREAAEIIRDVSQGPSPFFGAVVEKTIMPTKAK